jgi:CRP-like cAMP-binding protein
MYQRYFENFNNRVPISETERKQIEPCLTIRKLRRRQYLLQEGDIWKLVAFVEKGALRMYTVADSGAEHIIQFAIEGWFVGDLYSFLTGEPATYTIEAIEDSEVVVMSKADHDVLLKICPAYSTFHRELVTGAYIALQRRLNSIFSQPLEERYEAFMAQYPQIAQRVPQHMIASYLGLTPETLSRVRRRLASGK